MVGFLYLDRHAAGPLYQAQEQGPELLRCGLIKVRPVIESYDTADDMVNTALLAMAGRFLYEGTRRKLLRIAAPEFSAWRIEEAICH